MINYKNITLEQIASLLVMSNFDCVGMKCENCPLFSDEHGCGSQRAGNIIDQYVKETKQC